MWLTNPKINWTTKVNSVGESLVDVELFCDWINSNGKKFQLDRVQKHPKIKGCLVVATQMRCAINFPNNIVKVTASPRRFLIRRKTLLKNYVEFQWHLPTYFTNFQRERWGNRIRLQILLFFFFWCFMTRKWHPKTKKKKWRRIT
jgi:hypothetical protein